MLDSFSSLRLFFTDKKLGDCPIYVLGCTGALQKHVFCPLHDTMLGRARFEESGHLGKALLSTWITSVVTIKSSMFTHCINTKRAPVECLNPDVSPVHSRGHHQPCAAKITCPD